MPSSAASADKSQPFKNSRPAPRFAAVFLQSELAWRVEKTPPIRQSTDYRLADFLRFRMNTKKHSLPSRAGL
jgi:hypothetical protein